jgi:hypothetical protein
MARPVRTHPQTLQERLIPCAQFEALEAHCQARNEQGINSEKLTVKDDDDNNDAEAAEDPQGDPALVKTRLHKDTVNMFKRVLLFSQGAAVALYDNQMITTLDVVQDSLTTSSRSSAVPSGSQKVTYLGTKSPSFP